MLRRRRPMLTGFLLTLALVEVGLPLILFVLRDRMVFLPSRRPTAQEGLGYLRGRADVGLVWVPRRDGRLLAAYDAQPITAGDSGDPVVLFLHGNGGNIAGRAPILEEFVAGTGLRTLMVDYSGYGDNAGAPSEAEAHLDALAAFEWLVAEGVAPGRIVIYGESLGAAIALGVAAERECAAVVVQSGFASLSSMAFEIYPWLPLTGLLSQGSFPSSRRAARLEVPLLITHGTEDRVIPFSQGEKLFAAAGEGAEFLPIAGAGHNDFFAVAGSDYLAMLGRKSRAWTATSMTDR